MSLGNWEGKTSDEVEPEELPDFDAIKFLRLMGLRNYLTPFCIYMQNLYAEERFILFQWQKLLNKCRNNMGNGCG